MSNIKLFGNTKIQGKTFFQLSGSAPTPTYAIGRSIYNVNEGSSVTFTLSTTNVANGTTIPYTISGISLSDLSSGSLNGNFIVSNNLATATVSLTADNLTEGTEKLTIALFDGQPSSFALAIDTSTALPLALSNLVGWYDYTYGVYRTVGDDYTDESAPLSASWIGSFYRGLPPTWNTNQKPEYNENGRPYYSIPGSFYPVNGNDYTIYRRISWNGSSWVAIGEVYTEIDESYTYYPELNTVDVATGDTRYPWEANWGAGKTVTRITGTTSTPATNGQTVAKWVNRVYDPAYTVNNGAVHLYQETLASQPILSAGSIQFNNKSMYSPNAYQQFANYNTRTYYIVGNARNTTANNTRSVLNFDPTVSRYALQVRNTSGTQRYALNQGTSSSVNILSPFAPLSSWTGTPQIICASFDRANNGKISLNNSAEHSLSTIGNSFDFTNRYYIGGGSGSFINIKEILIYSTVHTTAQKTQVINYLNAKYNAF
jgi:hypothetical protein